MRDVVPIEETPNGGQRKSLTGLHRERDLVFLQRCVGLCTHAGEQKLGMRLDALGPAIAAQGIRRPAPGVAQPPPPAAHAGGADLEPLPRLSPRQPPGNRCAHAFTKVIRQWTGHAGWPPMPARGLNQMPADSGIPTDSGRSGSALALWTVQSLWTPDALWPADDRSGTDSYFRLRDDRRRGIPP